MIRLSARLRSYRNSRSSSFVLALLFLSQRASRTSMLLSVSFDIMRMKVFSCLVTAAYLWMLSTSRLIELLTMPKPCVLIESDIRLIETAFSLVESLSVSINVWLNMLYLKF